MSKRIEDDATTAHMDPGAQRRSSLLTELIGINSVNPLQAGERSGPGGEAQLAERLADITDSLGADVMLDEVAPGRPNVYARFPGEGPEILAIDVHLDTVGVEHMTDDDPFAARIADGRIHGRGSVDTKATFAVVLPLLQDMAATGKRPRGDLLLVGTVSEEAGGLLGAHRFREWAEEEGMRLNQILVGEPTNCAPVHGHKGGVGLNITVHGEAAHSSKPHLGRNAIVGAARIVAAFEEQHEMLVAGVPTTSVGSGTLSVTEITGGLARNIIPDRCEVYAGRRVAPGEDPEAIFAQLCLVAEQAAAPLTIDVEMSYGRCSPAFYQDPDSPLIGHLCHLAGAVPETATYGSNALAYRAIAEEIVVFGPGSIDQAHKADEWVAVSELDRAADIYQRWLAPT